MKLYYFQSEGGNFGDDLNLWLWPKILGRPFQGSCHHSVSDRPDNERERALFLGIGTLLNTIVPRSPVKYVFGTGAGYGITPEIDGTWRFFCVRGPLTAQALGLTPDLAITDPGALVRLVEIPSPSDHVRYSYMPHVRSVEIGLWKDVCDDLGIRMIDPRQDVDRTIADILGSEIVLTEAMHGAIVSDALRVPWIPVRSYDYINRFKWNDWCRSVQVSYQPEKLPALWVWPPEAGLHRRLESALRARWITARLRRIMQNPRPVLSSESTINILTHRLQERLEALRGSLKGGDLLS